jgi:hypothetical protein
MPSSSAPISREYPATSAANIAVNRRSTRSPLIPANRSPELKPRFPDRQA